MANIDISDKGGRPGAAPHGPPGETLLADAPVATRYACPDPGASFADAPGSIGINALTRGHAG